MGKVQLWNLPLSTGLFRRFAPLWGAMQRNTLVIPKPGSTGSNFRQKTAARARGKSGMKLRPRTPCFRFLPQSTGTEDDVILRFNMATQG